MNLTRPNNLSTLLNKFKPKPTLTLEILDTLLHQRLNLDTFNQILSQTILTSFFNDTFASSRFLKFAADSLFIPIYHSYKIFTLIQPQNAFVYNTMMRAFVHRDLPLKALTLYKLMMVNNVVADNYTYPILIQSCSIRNSEFDGKLVHGHVLKLGFEFDVYVKNTLINFYGVCENSKDAHKVFDGSTVLDSVSWNSMLAAYVSVGDVEEAKCVYDRMPERNVIASNSMIVLFGRKGDVQEARRLFDEMHEKDLVSWSALISSYEQNGMYEEALILFKEMNADKVMVDEVVIVSVLSACAHLVVGNTGKLIHALIVKIGIESYINLQNALIYMYSSCGELPSAELLFHGGGCVDLISWNSMISGYLRFGEVEKAETLFSSMPERDIVSWSALISGYAQHDRFSETLALFQEMQLHGFRPDETTLVSVISACTHLAALDQGKWVHAYIRKNDLKLNLIMGTTLLNMYMKFGCVEDALAIFHGMEEKGVSTWNALILGLAMNGLVNESLDMFAEMKDCGVIPNEITFIAVLGACRHMGLVDEGRKLFNSMTQEHKIEPNVKHYGCMVDLLGRAGMLKEAEKLIESMPMTPDVSTWGALLGACRKYGDHEMGEKVGRKLIELQPDHDGFHVLLSNMCASKGNWDTVDEIRGTMMQNRVVKTPGCSMMEANGTVHEFFAGDRTHPQIKDIDNMLDEIYKRLKMEGYAPETQEVALDIDEEEKETTLFRHSERLAIAYGLIAIDPPTPIRIMKNLRICNDCHTAAKLISRAFDRQIVVRDRHRFHNFNQGSCSCMDYW